MWGTLVDTPAVTRDACRSPDVGPSLGEIVTWRQRPAEVSLESCGFLKGPWTVADIVSVADEAGVFGSGPEERSMTAPGSVSNTSSVDTTAVWLALESEITKDPVETGTWKKAV